MDPDHLAVIRLNGALYGETDLADLRELRVDVNLRDGEWIYRCRDCRAPIVEYPDGWRDGNDNSPQCQGLEGDGTLRPHHPEPIALDWCERTMIIPNIGENSITVRLDLPGAAFCLTIKQETNGTLTLRVPHPDHASARKLTEQAPGIYEINE
jgi:hypothetical protein